jgi:Mrp family chromosome partitioning ATPase
MEPNTLPIHYAELEAVFARTLGNGTRALAVASAVGGEGATTLARALAERAAASGKRTLLVDLNLEHPSLHRHYALGRSDWSPEATPDRQAILPSDVEGLCVLPAPTQVSEHWGFRDPATLRATLERWLVQFDRVVVDTSPLTRRNRRNVPADTVCGACRKTLLVVLAARTPESQLVEARQMLDAAGAEITGAVLNDRHLPGLASELMRETRRLDHLMPRTMAWLRQRIAGSVLLNQPI